MDERELFVLANHTLAGVVAQVRAEQWEQVVPADFEARPGTRPTLREIIDTHAYDDAWIPEMLAGRSMAEVGEDAHRGDLLGADPAAPFAALGERANHAALGLTDLDATVHCSFGDFAAREFLWQAIFFRGIRARDVAKVVGAGTELPAALVEGMWDGLSPRAQEWRTWGVFPAPVPVPDDAPLQDRLLGLVGRDPAA